MLSDEDLARIERRLGTYIATDHPASTWAGWYREDVWALREQIRRLEALDPARGRYPSGFTKYDHYHQVPTPAVLTLDAATNPREIGLIVVHCAATPPDRDIGAADIDRWHRERGWAGIGYHWVIRRAGAIESGRDPARTGAHAAGHNARSLAVCLAGGVDAAMQPEDNFTAPQWVSLRGLLALLRARYPRARILGHRDLPGVGKACPSFDVRAKCAEWGIPTL